MMFLNRESLNYNEKTNANFTDYNRTIGIEYNLASANNAWVGKAMLVKSFSPQAQGNDLMQAYNTFYVGSNWELNLQYENIGQNYNPEVGYVPRTGYQRLSSPGEQYNFYAKKRVVIIFM